MATLNPFPMRNICWSSSSRTRIYIGPLPSITLLLILNEDLSKQPMLPLQPHNVIYHHIVGLSRGIFVFFADFSPHPKKTRKTDCYFCIVSTVHSRFVSVFTRNAVSIQRVADQWAHALPPIQITLQTTCTAEVLGASIDSKFAHRAWTHRIDEPLDSGTHVLPIPDGEGWGEGETL